MKQYKVSLPDELYERLAAASEKSGRSLSDEIRTRIVQSLEGDQHTRIMADAVVLIAAEVEKETGERWHKHAGAWETFREAISARLNLFKKPSGSAKFGDRPNQSIPEDEPGFIGRWIAVKVWENPDWTNSPERAAMEKGFRDLKAIKGGKS